MKKLIVAAMMVLGTTSAFAGDSDALKEELKAKTYAEAEALVKQNLGQLANDAEKAKAYNKLVDLSMKAFNDQQSIQQTNQIMKKNDPVDENAMNEVAPDMNNRIDDRIMLKDLVDRYATESDKNNQDYYVNIFRSDVKLKVYFGDKLGLDISSVDDMIAQYKAFGAAKASFHQNGQQVVDFVDDTHATGICYAIATLVNEEEGKDKLTFHAVRYYDKYEKIDGRWWITEREQHFVYSAVPPLM
jgi:hypothetical protein